MWHFRTWFSRHGGVGLTVGLDDLKGIAPNTMLAKMCSDHKKPNGQCRIAPETQAVLNFLKDLPIRKVREIMTFTIVVG
ncbi:hypothetical protein QYF61_014455 [Mycteria americana]|uniref:UmuC domain-containing protein n=1 Tax=Mycteria americana TaxID=33587 RepID=A0AAN7NHN9_MYCAM|nr:hypothetical protein QYF61_014455 [Mycteria americana]